MAAGSVAETKRDRSSEDPSRRRSSRIWRAFTRMGRLACCSGCLRRFEPRNRHNAIFCSRECYFRNKATIGAFIRLRHTEAKATRLASRQCRICGGLFSPVASIHAICSAECRQAHVLRRSKELFRVGRLCRTCGNHLSLLGEFTNFCSGTCRDRWYTAAKRHAKHVRRLRIRKNRKEGFNPIDVYRRDKWRCQRCGCRCPKRFIEGVPQSPTLDHIIPVSKGGEHSMANTQLLCWQCNIDKGDSIGGDQMRIC